MRFHWTYFTLMPTGHLRDDESREVKLEWPPFEDINEAEDFLERKGIRGNVREHEDRGSNENIL